MKTNSKAIRTKNPSFLAQIEQRSRDETSIANMPEWETLTYPQKKFLAYYIRYRDFKRAQIESGVTMDWVVSQEAFESFNTIVAVVINHPLQFAQLLAVESISLSMIHLLEIMEDPETQRMKLDVIKHLHNVTGVFQSKEDTNPNLLNQIQINMFDTTQLPAQTAEMVNGAKFSLGDGSISKAVDADGMWMDEDDLLESLQ